MFGGSVGERPWGADGALQFGDDKGSFHAEKRAEYDDLYTLEWVNKSYYDHGVYNGWFLVLDSANDVSC